MSMSASAAAAAASSSTTTKKAGLIFLHGLGDGPSGWRALAKQLPALQPILADVEYVFPQSPTIPISINGGMRMPGWFDLYQWPISVGDPDDKVGKIAAIQQMEGEIQAMVQRGIPRHKIAVGGFSQGGAIALLTAYYSAPPEQAPRPPLAGCVSLSGWLTLSNEIKVANPSTPLFWAHGKYDDKVLFAHQKFGSDTLKSGGVTDITQKEYPMGHESSRDELIELASFLKRVLFDDTKDNNNKEL
ncbi:hypothetical protein ACA910_000988 [Epithemia clementina (nom. ined.)]